MPYKRCLRCGRRRRGHWRNIVGGWGSCLDLRRRDIFAIFGLWDSFSISSHCCQVKKTLWRVRVRGQREVKGG